MKFLKFTNYWPGLGQISSGEDSHGPRAHPELPCLGFLFVRSPSLCLLARPPRFFQIEIEVYLYTTLIASHPYYPMSVC